MERTCIFDLDVIIYNKLFNLIRQNFTLLDDTWWRRCSYDLLNSSVVSWTGDVLYLGRSLKNMMSFL